MVIKLKNKKYSADINLSKNENEEILEIDLMDHMGNSSSVRVNCEKVCLSF